MSTPTNVISGVENVVLPVIEQDLLQDAEAYIGALAAADQKRFPKMTAPELAVQVNGDLKHAVRTKLGFFGFTVDIFWGEVQFQTALTPLIQSSIAALPNPPAS
jgi:hypothetical protein